MEFWNIWSQWWKVICLLWHFDVEKIKVRNNWVKNIFSSLSMYLKKERNVSFFALIFKLGFTVLLATGEFPIWPFYFLIRINYFEFFTKKWKLSCHDLVWNGMAVPLNSTNMGKRSFCEKIRIFSLLKILQVNRTVGPTDISRFRRMFSFALN